MGSIISGAIGLATAILQYMNNHEAMKYVDQLNRAQTDLINEKAKGYNADDAKIEGLQAQIGVLLQTVQSELRVFAAAKGPGGGVNANDGVHALNHPDQPAVV